METLDVDKDVADTETLVSKDSKTAKTVTNISESKTSKQGSASKSNERSILYEKGLQ